MADGGAQSGMNAFRPSKETEREFRHALGRFATGVCVVTTAAEDGPVGITVNSFAAVSLDPPLVLWSVAETSQRYHTFAAATNYAIHVLGDNQSDLGHHFSKAGDDFGSVEWSEGPGGTPLLAGCLARFECEMDAQHTGGDHMIVVGRVTAAEYRDGEPLLFSSGRYGWFTGGL